MKSFSIPLVPEDFAPSTPWQIIFKEMGSTEYIAKYVSPPAPQDQNQPRL
jgi:hypothetical protein